MSGKRFARELTDLPQRMSEAGVILHRIQRNSAKSPRMVACLLCGSEDVDRVRGLCRCCNPWIERWRLWRVDLQGQPPHYDAGAVRDCTGRQGRAGSAGLG